MDGDKLIEGSGDELVGMRNKRGVRRSIFAILELAVLVGCATTTTTPAELTGASAADRAATPAPQEMRELTGRVTVIGSDPFVLLVIVTDAEEEYELVGESAEALWDIQQQRVTVRGRVVRQARGPGFPAQFEVDSYRPGAGP